MRFFINSVPEALSPPTWNPQRITQTRSSTSWETTPPCTMPYTRYTSAPWWSEPTWTTSSPRSQWTRWPLQTGATRCCSWAQVGALSPQWTLRADRFRDLLRWRKWVQRRRSRAPSSASENIHRADVELLIVVADRGTVQKVIVLPRDDLQTEELVLEEVEVFKVSLPNVFCLLCICQSSKLFIDHLVFYCRFPRQSPPWRFLLNGYVTLKGI